MVGVPYGMESKNYAFYNFLFHSVRKLVTHNGFFSILQVLSL